MKIKGDLNKAKDIVTELYELITVNNVCTFIETEAIIRCQSGVINLSRELNKVLETKD